MGIFLTSGKGSRVPAVTFPDTPVTIQMPLPPVQEMELGGSDVNLVLMVQEQVPRRLTMIDKELKEMESRTAKLVSERVKLERLLKAVED